FPSEARLSQSPGRVIVHIFAGWLGLAALLVLLGHFSGLLAYFERDTLITWGLLAPWCQLGAHFGLRAAAPALRGRPKTALLAGMNASGLELARRLKHDVYSSVRIFGFVEDRSSARLEIGLDPLLGRIEDLPQLVKRHRVDLVYLALPMVSSPRTAD